MLLAPVALLLARRAEAAEDSWTSFSARSGLQLELPRSWVIASDRVPSSSSTTEVLFFAGDFSSTVETVAVRRMPLTQEVAAALSAQVSAADAAAMLTSAERASVDAGTAVGRVSGVQSGSSSLAGLSILDAEWKEPGRFLLVTTESETCRGNVLEGRGGERRCEGPAGDELPFVRRTLVTAYVVAGGQVYNLRAGCLAERYADVSPVLQRVARSLVVPAA